MLVFRTTADRTSVMSGTVNGEGAYYCWGQDPGAVEYWVGETKFKVDAMILARRLHGHVGIPPN